MSGYDSEWFATTDEVAAQMRVSIQHSRIKAQRLHMHSYGQSCNSRCDPAGEVAVLEPAPIAPSDPLNSKRWQHPRKAEVQYEPCPRCGTQLTISPSGGIFHSNYEDAVACFKASEGVRR